MKLNCLILIIASVCLTSRVVFAQEDGVDFNGDFFQGMESGFFLRDTENGHREYDCPDPKTNNDALKKINSVLGPVQMLLNLVENDFITVAFKSIDIVVNSVFNIIAAVDGYGGSEFCSGLLFGIAGSNLVLSLGRNLMEQMDNIEKRMANSM